MIYDTVIVGGGSAGCVLANRLSAHADRSVLLLEAGPDYSASAVPGSVAAVPDDIADGTRIASSHDWGYRDEQGRPVPRGRLMGGSSAVNACFALRGHPGDYDAWGLGWTWDDVYPAFREIESDRDFGDRPEHGRAGELPIRRYADLTPVQSAFLAAASDYSTVDDHNRPGAVGVGLLPTNCVDGRRISAATAFLDPVRDRPNLHVRADAMVSHVALHDGRATGVVLADGLFIEAGQVILSAGAYASPAILLRSGFDHPWVGRGLTDHAGVSIDFAAPADWPLFPTFQSLLTLHSCLADPSGPPDLQIFPGGAWAGGDAKVACLCIGLVKPASRGRVWLRNGDPATAPHIDLAHLREEQDRIRIADGVRHAEAIAETMTGTRATADLASAWTYHHPVGTCGIGRVVDATGRVDGIEGLAVVDASVMPDIPSANTNLPTIMLAHRMAAGL